MNKFLRDVKLVSTQIHEETVDIEARVMELSTEYDELKETLKKKSAAQSIPRPTSIKSSYCSSCGSSPRLRRPLVYAKPKHLSNLASTPNRIKIPTPTKAKSEKDFPTNMIPQENSLPNLKLPFPDTLEEFLND